MKRTITITSAAALLFMVICIFTICSSYAAQDMKLSEKSLDMDKADSYEVVFVERSCEERIANVEASKNGIVYLSIDSDDCFGIIPDGKGDVVLKVTGDDGTVIQLPVHVGEKAVRKALEEYTRIYDMMYGCSSAYVETLPGAKITVEIGKAAYTAIAPDNDIMENEAVKINLKNVYNIGTKIKYTVEVDGVTYSHTSKVKKDDYLDQIRAKGKVFTVLLYSAHKGDVIKIRYAGKTYTRKIKKNYNYDTTIKIKVKKAIKKNVRIKLEMRNRYKTVLVKKNIKLKKGLWLAYRFC